MGTDLWSVPVVLITGESAPRHNRLNDCGRCIVRSFGGLPGSAGLVLAKNVTYIDPSPAVFMVMLEWWTRQQKARFLKDATIESRLALLRRFADFTNDYPWSREPTDVEAFVAELRSGSSPTRYLGRRSPSRDKFAQGWNESLSAYRAMLVRNDWYEVALDGLAQGDRRMQWIAESVAPELGLSFHTGEIAHGSNKRSPTVVRALSELAVANQGGGDALCSPPPFVFVSELLRPMQRHGG